MRMRGVGFPPCRALCLRFTFPVPSSCMVPCELPAFQVIAHVRSPYVQRIDAPHQPTVTVGTESGRAEIATIEFVEGFPQAAFRDLQGFDRIWLIFLFHRSEGWKPEVRPPRGGGKRSVLATRAIAKRENISLFEPNAWTLQGIDLLDATPILDIKPYVPYTDSFPEASAGWIDALDAQHGLHSAPGPRKPRR